MGMGPESPFLVPTNLKRLDHTMLISLAISSMSMAWELLPERPSGNRPFWYSDGRAFADSIDNDR